MSMVTLCECFARDGLQHEPAFIPTDAKRALVERFADIGFPRVEATSYSNPKVVPQFADASELLKILKRKSKTKLFQAIIWVGTRYGNQAAVGYVSMSK